MLNKERPEVVKLAFDVIEGELSIYQFCDIVGINTCEVVSTNERKKIRDWLNSEYVEPYKITQAEKVILENIDKTYEWIARDGDWTSEINVFTNEPVKCARSFGSLCGNCAEFYAFNHLFPFLTFEGGALKIRDILNNCEVVG